MNRYNLGVVSTYDLYIIRDTTNLCCSTFPSLLLPSTPVVFFHSKDGKYTQLLCISKVVRETVHPITFLPLQDCLNRNSFFILGFTKVFSRLLEHRVKNLKAHF